MSSIFMTDDLLDYLKYHIDIRDYDKLKMVSYKYKRYFDLRPLIISKKYSDIMIIKGCSMRILINIIAKNVVNKCKYENDLIINNKIIKNEKEFSLVRKNRGHYLMQYLTELYYSCYNNDYDNIIKTILVFSKICNKIINLHNFTYFITPIMCYIEDVFEDTISFQKDNNFINTLLDINLNLFLSIIIKRIKTIIPKNSFTTFDLLSNIQNNKLDDIIFNNINYDADGKCFPDYYIKYVTDFAIALYIH